MFVFACKTTKKQLAWAAVCGCLVLAIVLTVSLTPSQTTVVANTASSYTVTTAEEGAAFLRQRGYEVSGGDVREIRLPDELDETLSAYATLLEEKGIDLTQYLGKRVKYRTYTVENHESGNATAHLYIYKDTVIAGDVTVDGVPTILDKG